MGAAAAFDSALRQTARPQTFDFSSDLRSFNLRNLNLRIFDLIVFIARISTTTLKVPKSLNLLRLPLRYFLLNFPTRSAYSAMTVPPCHFDHRVTKL
jgi:hypothetical protein